MSGLIRAAAGFPTASRASTGPTFDSLLVANRGEIAVRIMATAERRGLRTIAVHSDADAHALHVRRADEAHRLGPAPVQSSYLDIDAVLAAAERSGAQAIHPGYGLLSENAAFARRVQEAGLIWVGPEPEAMEALSDKIRARELMMDAGVPVARGTASPPEDAAAALREADRIGYPLMLKAAGGGGGIGMSVMCTPEELSAGFESARTRAQRMFGSADLLLERQAYPARHVEVQVVGTGDGRIFAVGDRDCSVQRRFQKVVEESPAPRVEPQVRAGLHAAAVAAADAVSYTGAGTVEFLLNPETGEFVFLEMNTRLQVEHPVTEMVTGLDLVDVQLRVAGGEFVDLADVAIAGHAIEFRLYAEDPVRFMPSPGAVTVWHRPQRPWLRIDSGYEAGDEVSRWYDPLVAKICVHGEDRAQTLARAQEVLDEVEIGPVTTNLDFLRRVVLDDQFVAAEHGTEIVGRMMAPSPQV